MHLVKWFRKNMTKLMAIFVILIMIAFIMPSLLQQLSKPRFSGPNKAMWLYGDEGQISFNNISQATKELGVLKSLYIDRFLLGQQDLKFVLAGQLLFPDAATGALLNDEIKKIAARNQFKVSQGRIDEFFSQTKARAELFWILLKAESKSAGCSVSTRQASEILKMIIQQASNNSLDAATVVGSVSQANHMTEEQVLQTFADLLAITSYAGIVNNIEDVTEAQIASMVSAKGNSFDANFVEFNANTFLKEVNEPSEEEIIANFNKYKNNQPGNVTEENPYGFGYKQQPRVALEYMMIKLEDVKKLINVVTEEEAEDFYQQNLEKFIEQIPSDPNDPNSEKVQRQKTYAEVVSGIKNFINRRRVSAKVTGILADAVELAEAGYEGLDFETATPQQFKRASVDYSVAAEKIAAQNNVKIYTGKTALLTAGELQLNQSLAGLMMQGQSTIPTRLVKLAFAVEQLGEQASVLGPYEPVKPKMFVSIGPLTDNMGAIVAMVRLIDTANSQVPSNVDFSYARKFPQLYPELQSDEDYFVLKDEIKKNCKLLKAFGIAAASADEFVKLAKKDSWQGAIDKFNKKYPAEDTAAQKPFKTQQWKSRRRVWQSEIEAAKLNLQNIPGAETMVAQTLGYAGMMDSFLGLFEADNETAENLPKVIEFKPAATVYVVKDLTRKFATIQDYYQNRSQIAFGQDYVTAQSLMFEYYMPKNIEKRLNLRPAQQDIEADSNSPDTKEGQE